MWTCILHIFGSKLGQLLLNTHTKTQPRIKEILNNCNKFLIFVGCFAGFIENLELGRRSKVFASLLLKKNKHTILRLYVG